MISGFWLPQFPLPLIRIGMNLPGISDRWELVTLVIDTGATKTALHPLDSVRVFRMSAATLDSASWLSVNPSGGVGGNANYTSMPAKYAFYHDDGTTPELLGHTVEVAELTAHNQSLPSILGWDMLEHFHVTLHGRESITLERI